MDLRRARFEKGRRWKTVPVGQKSLMKEVEEITAGAVTSGKRCPDPFAPATPRFATSSLRERLLNKWRRSITTNRIACSAMLLVGSTFGVVMNSK